MLLGIGNSSNIMFNVGGTTISSRTRMVLLEGASRKEAARTFPSQENVPAGIITMGYLYDDECPQRDLDGLGRG